MQKSKIIFSFEVLLRRFASENASDDNEIFEGQETF